MNRTPRHRLGAALAGAGLLIGLFTVFAPAARADHGAHVDGPKTANNELNRCNGVVNGGVGNTGKELLVDDSNLEPGGWAAYQITFPAGENPTSTLAVVDCLFRNGERYELFDITEIPLVLDENGIGSFTVTFSTSIPLDAGGDEFCNVAQTTGGTGGASAGVRKTNMPCFTVTEGGGGGDPTGAGRLEVSKAITDELTGDDDLTFRFNVACTGDGPAKNFNNQAVETDESWTSPAGDLIPAGYVCSVTERTNPGQLPDAGEDAEWGTPTYSAAQVTIVDEETAELTITNARVTGGGGDEVGDLWISKTTVGSIGSFTFDVYCDDGSLPLHDPQNVPVQTTTAGVAATVEVRTGVPVGTECTVTEDTPTDTDWSMTSSPAGDIVIVEGDGNVAAFTNTYDGGGSGPVLGGGGDPVTGPLTVAKVVQGVPAAERSDYTFTFGVDCTGTAFDGTVQITGEGSSVFHNALPAGTVCEVTETAISPQSETDRWTTSSTDTDGGVLGTVTIADAAGETVTFTNTRTAVEGTTVTPPAPADTPAPAVVPPAPATVIPEVRAGTEVARTATLARTGVETGTLLVIAGLFLALGGILWSWAEIGGRRAGEILA